MEEITQQCPTAQGYKNKKAEVLLEELATKYPL